MGTTEFTRQGMSTRDAEARGRKRIPSKRKSGYLPPSQRITTDDVVDLFKNISLSVAACAGAIHALRKIGNALSKRDLGKNLSDITKDAKQQIRRSLDTIEIAIKRSRTTFWGKRRREPYGPYGKKGGKYKFQVKSAEDEE